MQTEVTDLIEEERRIVGVRARRPQGEREVDTQKRGDQWLDAMTEPLLIVPSVIMPLASASDPNVLINHRHPGAAAIAIAGVVSFELDPRLFQP